MNWPSDDSATPSRTDSEASSTAPVIASPAQSARQRRPSANKTRRPGTQVQSRSQGEPMKVAARLMSETAHDLRSPLTTVRETVRLVRNGEIGQVSEEQIECLDAVIDQCDCINQMVGEMLQLERLQTGTPRVNRQWQTAELIQQDVLETLKPWSLPRQINIAWDSPNQADLIVFADASMLRRLIVNLVVNAIRVTPEGGTILIRLSLERGGETVKWSIIDQGCGIKSENLTKISQRNVSGSGGEGLGLSICRQLAALHFSNLQIRSRVGTGTEVSFETPAGSPSNVAEAWTRWRNQQRGPLQQPTHRSTREVLGDANPKVRRVDQIISRSRLDPPSVVVQLSHDSDPPRCEDRLIAGNVVLGATLPRNLCNHFDKVLQSNCQFYDFVYRVDTRRWVWIFDTEQREIASRIKSINQIALAEIEGIRTDWSKPQLIHLNRRGTAARISDLLIRETLTASAPISVRDHNEVRLGTDPIEPSQIPALRLDDELQRLTQKIGRQARQFAQHSKKLRPR